MFDIGCVKPLVDTLRDFQVYQIICLEYEDTRLYAEVIQVAAARQTCWVRPLVLVVSSSSITETELQLGYGDQTLQFYDLRQGADLLWPTKLFREALDTEVLPLLLQLESQDHKADHQTAALAARQRLQQFIHQVWQAHPGMFQAK